MNGRELSQKLASRALEIAQLLLPAGQRSGTDWVVGNIDGEKGKSLHVRLHGERAGLWIDHATGAGGDLLALWMAVRQCSFVEAFRQASDLIGEPAVTAARASVTRPPVFFTRPSRPTNTVGLRGACASYLTETRKLPVEVLKQYRVACTKDDTAIVFPFLRDGELLNIKRLQLERPEGKKVVSQEKGAEPCLWGWQAVGDNARQLVITEGEIDAMSMAALGYTAVSMPGGASNLQWIDNDYDRLERFDDLVLCFDMDEPGKKAATQVADRLGKDRCRIVALPNKDANEFLVAGGTAAEMQQLVDRAKAYQPKELRFAGEFYDEVFKEFYGDSSATDGIALPFGNIRPDEFHLRLGELSVWTGYNGHGKSLLLTQLAIDAMSRGTRVCMFSGEYSVAKSLRRMARQAGNVKEPTPDYLKTIIEWFGDRLVMIDVDGSIAQPQLFEAMKYAATRYGCTFFIIDNLLKVDGVYDEDLKSQHTFINKLTGFRSAQRVHVALVAHPRKGMSEHDRPGKMDVRGGGSITDLADTVVTVFRNKRKEQGDPKAPDNDAIIEVCKQRLGDWEGVRGLDFDKLSQQFYTTGEVSRSYVPYVAATPETRPVLRAVGGTAVVQLDGEVPF